MVIMEITGHKTSFLKYIKITKKEHAETLKRYWSKEQENKGYTNVLRAVKQFDMRIFEIDIKEGAYSSDDYEFYVKRGNWEQNKAFTKTYYIEDKKTRLEKVRGLLQGNNDLENKVTVTTPKLEDWQKYNFEDFEDYLKAKKERLYVKYSG